MQYILTCEATAKAGEQPAPIIFSVNGDSVPTALELAAATLRKIDKSNTIHRITLELKSIEDVKPFKDEQGY